MGTYWAFFAWPGGGTSTSSAAAGRIRLSSASCLSFGGTGRGTFQGNININEWNQALHYAKNTDESSTDYCAAPHLWPIHPVINEIGGNFTLRDTACSTATYIKMVNGDPDTAKGIGLRFYCDTQVRCNPVQVWAGTGTNATSPLSNCFVAMADLSSGNAGEGAPHGPEWSTVNSGSKFTLKPHGTAAYEHWWSVAISVMPNQVGFTNTNKMRVEATYY